LTDSVSIPKRFNGPLDSGNGGYSCGVIANLVEGQAEVSLRRPVPLDTPLTVVRGDDGSVRALDGRDLVLDAHPRAELDLDVPAPVGLPEAREAMSGYEGSDNGPFCRCFVCGRARADSYRVFAGPLDERDVVASAWTPAAEIADADGNVPDELVCAVLDCPTYFATYVDAGLPLSFLARFAARIDAPVRAGDDHVVIGWPIEDNGRKRVAGSAVLTPDGDVLAVAEALLVEPR
jgi:hypothetical protein